MLTKQELSLVIQDATDLLKTLNLDAIRQRKNDLQERMNDNSLWENPSLAARLNKELSDIEEELSQAEQFKNLTEELQIARELDDQDQFNLIHKKLIHLFETLQNQTFLSGPFDKSGTILSIHAGAGGVDAQDFAAMLASMYQTFCKNQNWECLVVNISSGEEGGLKSITLDIKGHNSYGILKEEAGVHRLVRISPFNSGKTRETSFALVEALPDNLDSQVKVEEIPESDLKWEYSMSSGKGGQSVNTTYSAVRLVHLPTGLAVTCQNERSQTQNKQQALKYLRNKLAALEIKKVQELKSEIKGDVQSAEWGSQIRSYVLHPYKLVKDHRSGQENSNPESVLEYADLLPFVWAMKKAKKEVV